MVSLAVNTSDEIVNEDCFASSDRGQSFRGRVKQTVRGFQCQGWNASYPVNRFFTPHNFPDQGLSDGPYCRNPGGLFAAPWCYVNDPNGVVTFDYCEVPSCSEDDFKCYHESGMTYRGTHSLTISGRTCQNWASVTPHQHTYLPSEVDKRVTGIDQHNYCRNPQGFGAPWCYTTDPLVRWEYCFPLDCLGLENDSVCEYTPWSSWSNCSETTQDGKVVMMQQRSRSIRPAKGSSLYLCPVRVFKQHRVCQNDSTFGENS